MHLVLVDAEKWVIECLPRAGHFYPLFMNLNSLRGVEGGRGGSGLGRRPFARLLQAMVQAGPLYAHGSWERRGWENHEKTIPGPRTPKRRGCCGHPAPVFPPGTRCLQLELFMQSGGSGVSGVVHATDNNVPICPSKLER